jgi:hypothetical protein
MDGFLSLMIKDWVEETCSELQFHLSFGLLISLSILMSNYVFTFSSIIRKPADPHFNYTFTFFRPSHTKQLVLLDILLFPSVFVNFFFVQLVIISHVVAKVN